MLLQTSSCTMHDSLGVLFQRILICIVVASIIIAQNESVYAFKKGKRYSGKPYTKRSVDGLLPKENTTHETSNKETRNKRIVDTQLNQLQTPLRFDTPSTNGFVDPRGLTPDVRGSSMRQNLLSELEHHIQERNMLLRQSNLMRENELLREKEILQRPLLSENDLIRRKSSMYNNNGLFSRPSDSMLLENQLARQMHDSAEEEALLAPNHFFPNMGNLGDETLPYGSLGETRGYIPLGRIDDQLLPSEEMTDVVPAMPRHHKAKKTWVTDVNVYSKKKKMDDINDLFGSDDNDPLDEYDPCDANQCRNGGLCKVVGNTEFMCICPRTFKGKHCEVRNHCHPNPCAHGSTCTETETGFKCACAIGFKGNRCRDRNFCLPNPCENEGVCTESSSTDGFSCFCKEGWLGHACDTRKTPCTPNPCQHDGHCLTDGVTFECLCQKGLSGKLCEDTNGDTSLETMATMLHVNHETPIPIEHAFVDENAVSKSNIASRPLPSKFPCAVNPCLHGGVCVTDSSHPNGHRCDCPGSYTGVLCSEKKCQCQNEGTCIGEGTEGKCICKPGFGGPLCSEHTQCNDNTCMHGGICIEQVGGFKCKCDNGYKGKRCDMMDKCKPNPCLHDGECKDYGDFTQCGCKHGFKGKHCEEIDFCAPSPCHNAGQCFGYPGGYQCECIPGYRGKTCDQKVHCLSTPCSNGAECIELLPTAEKPEGSYKCGCRSGFMGPTCEDHDLCSKKPCHNGGTCTNFRDGFMCSCPVTFHGELCQHINHCYGSPCRNNGKCISGEHEFKCDCQPGFRGVLCNDIDYCEPNPCKNNGYCTSNSQKNGFVCHCAEGLRGLTCSDVDACFPNPCLHGDCREIAGGYMCNCTKGFRGPKCSEVNHCDPNPCFHSGECMEINGGDGYVCQCRKGYKGEFCERKDYCHPNPCGHDGICHAFSSQKKYQIANEEVSDVGCICAKGYRGKRCNEMDPCYPNPCLHNSACLSNEKSLTTTCNCSVGWKGEQCQSLDLCSPDPCRYGTHCIQTDEESYQCVKNLCQPTPCQNGGKCIVVNNEYAECACPKAWTGKHCKQRDFCYPNPCMNTGTCQQKSGGGFACTCSPQFSGQMCEDKRFTAPSVEVPATYRNFCADAPCKNGGSCVNSAGKFYCRCSDGFQGPFCEESVCIPSPCSNGGTCIPYYGIALCKCTIEYSGAHCSALKNADSLAKTREWQTTHPVVKSITPHVNATFPYNMAKANIPSSVSRGNTQKNIQSNPSSTLVKAYIPPSTLSDTPPNVVKANATSLSVDKPLTMRDMSSPAFIEKVVEILNGDNDKTEIVQTVAATSPQQLLKQPSNTRYTDQQRGSIKATIPQQNTEGTASQITVAAAAAQNLPGQQQQKSQPFPTMSQYQQSRIQPSPNIVAINDPCATNPCKNQATCVVRSNGEIECVCPQGFSGPLCADIGNNGYSSAPKFFPKDECNHCDVNAICVNGHCICEQGYVGDGLECWVKTMEDVQWSCDVNPCQNGGTCKHGRAQCVCRLGYVGKYCEKYCPPAVHLSFDSVKGDLIMDESGNRNHAVLKNGAVIVKQQGKCDSAVAMQGGDVFLNGMAFQPKPRDGVTIALWVKLDTIYGSQSIFDTVGGTMSNHTDGQYHLEIDDGKIRWFHRNEIHATVFDVRAQRLVGVNTWVHVVGTYDGYKRLAKLYMDGDVVGEYRNTGMYWQLSQDWETKAGLGKHMHPHGDRLLRGMLDEFFIFDCALPRLEILVLMHHCKVYFKNDKNAKAIQNKFAGNSVPSIYSSPLQQQQQQRITANNNNQPYNSRYTNDSLLQQAFPVRDQTRFQNYLRFQVKESSYSPSVRDSVPGSFPPSNLQITRNMPLASRKSSVPKQINLYGKYHYVAGPSAFYIRDLIQQPSNTNARRTQMLKSSISHPNYYWPKLQLTNSRVMFRQQPLIYMTEQKIQRSRFPYLNPKQPIADFGHRREHITGPSALFSQLPSSAHTYMGIETPNSRNMVLTPAMVQNERLLAAQRGISSVAQNVPTAVRSGTPQTVVESVPLLMSQSAKSQQSYTQISDPRWFSWTQGLAQTSGKTHTNTHSNSLQKNDPGTVATDTHVQSSQGSQSDTNVKQMYTVPIITDAAQEQRKFDILHNLGLLQLENADRRQEHNVGHTHQWGYGNGNGKGYGTGTPGASGSGGGWGTGGPVSQGMSLPAWEGDKPPQPQPLSEGTKPAGQSSEQPQRKDNLFSIAMHPLPVQTLQIWNTYLNAAASKRQSTSGATANTDNVASSNVDISNGNNDVVTASNHHWGFGNGNGDGHGGGPGNGDGTGGGWGTGGPTKTKLQVNQPNQRHMVNPWISDQPKRQSNNNQQPLLQTAGKNTIVDSTASSVSPFLTYIKNSLPQTIPYNSATVNLLQQPSQNIAASQQQILNNYLQQMTVADMQPIISKKQLISRTLPSMRQFLRKKHKKRKR